MQIHTLSFEEPLVITIDGQVVQVIAFKTQDPGIIKFGVEAPRSINIHREEVYQAIMQKQLQPMIE
ncbi:MAG: carbon storage regulator [Legionella sp.]